MKKNASATMQTAAVAEQGAHDAPEHAASTKQATGTKGAPRGKKASRKGKDIRVNKAAVAGGVVPLASKSGRKKPTNTTTVPREFSKKAIVLDLLRRKDGATLGEIAKATGWQNHSIRGFISSLPKTTGITITSTRRDSDKARVYEAMK